jgi:hypothetical protein
LQFGFQTSLKNDHFLCQPACIIPEKLKKFQLSPIPKRDKYAHKADTRPDISLGKPPTLSPGVGGEYAEKTAFLPLFPANARVAEVEIPKICRQMLVACHSGNQGARVEAVKRVGTPTSCSYRTHILSLASSPAPGQPTR